AVTGRDPARAEALARRITTAGGRAVGYGLDARDVREVGETTRRVVDAFGGIDVLVNCVGIQREQALLDVTEATFDEVYQTNLKSAMFLAQAVARQQIAQGGGGRQIHLLWVRSQLALRGRGYSAYCATKGGLAMLVKQHAMELAPHNITVNGVPTTSSRWEWIRHHRERDGFRDIILERNPLGRIREPLGVGGQLIALAAPAGRCMTRQIIVIDGAVTPSQWRAVHDPQHP